VATKSSQHRERLSTVFLTGPGGIVYEFPAEVAAKHALSPERAEELGNHLPIIPYGTPSTGALPAQSTGKEADVEGRHHVWRMDQFGHWDRVLHPYPLYGPFRGFDGMIYIGRHCHPYGTEIGVPC
jgi:hypothetical protein